MVWKVDIDLWELNEAFASQCLIPVTSSGIDPDKYNVTGGSIAIGHPFGMTARAYRPHPARRPSAQGKMGRRDNVHRRRPAAPVDQLELDPEKWVGFPKRLLQRWSGMTI
jgi:hypothetical protein